MWNNTLSHTALCSSTTAPSPLYPADELTPAWGSTTTAPVLPTQEDACIPNRRYTMSSWHWRQRGVVLLSLGGLNQKDSSWQGIAKARLKHTLGLPVTTLSRLGEIAILLNRQQQKERVKKNKETTEYVPNKRAK